MSIQRFEVTPSSDLVDVQRRIRAVVDSLGPAAWAKELVGVTVGTTSTAIPHGLGYQPKHVWISLGGTSAVVQAAAPDATFVYLSAAGGPLTCNVLVV